jgi:hypothetical protein
MGLRLLHLVQLSGLQRSLARSDSVSQELLFTCPVRINKRHDCRPNCQASSLDPSERNMAWVIRRGAIEHAEWTLIDGYRTSRK